MTTVGAYARIDLGCAAAIREELAQLDGVELFELDEPGKLGLIVEADDLDAAHTMLTCDVTQTPGVMGVWPIYVNVDGS